MKVSISIMDVKSAVLGTLEDIAKLLVNSYKIF